MTWWQEQRLIDRQSEFHSSSSGGGGDGEVRNVLKLERLGRVDLRTTVSCQAYNTQLSHPLTKSAIVELTCK